jgi:hypothetical protein
MLVCATVSATVNSMYSVTLISCIDEAYVVKTVALNA